MSLIPITQVCTQPSLSLSSYHPTLGHEFVRKTQSLVTFRRIVSKDYSTYITVIIAVISVTVLLPLFWCSFSFFLSLTVLLFLFLFYSLFYSPQHCTISYILKLTNKVIIVNTSRNKRLMHHHFHSLSFFIFRLSLTFCTYSSSSPS